MQISKLNIFSQPRNLILIFSSLAVLMIFSALFELNQSKKELMELMTGQSHSLLESLIITSGNTLEANNYIDTEFKKRLLNNANFIKNLYEQGKISNQILEKISTENEIYRINIYNSKGEKIYSNHEQEHTDLPEKFNPRQILEPIFAGIEDTLILGLKPARYEDGYRYAIALAAKNRNAVVINIDAAEYQDFRRRIGFGGLLRSMATENDDILYACLQDTFMILAASGNVKVLDRITNSPFLTNALRDSLFSTRITEFDTLEVFEAVHPFSYQGAKIGLFRLGLSLQPLNDINNRIYRRLIIITIILVIVGSFMLTFLFTRERFTTLQKKYYEVETYSGNIIDNVSDAIIVFDMISGIKIFNSAAEELFQVEKEKVLNASIGKVLNEADCQKILEKESLIEPMECLISNQRKYLLVSKSQFLDSDGQKNTIILFRDLTKQKQLEIQMERKERLSAMGELASGVAHEIRNPLNTIGTIVQQLNKDFEPQKDQAEYHDLADLVYSEVKRINETIHDFLRFSRPEKIQPESFVLDDFMHEIQTQYKAELSERNISFDLLLNWHGTVDWDPRQMKQVLLNIFQNAIEAIEKDGKIALEIISSNNSELEIILRDSGPGMSKEVKDRIFNLYYTTKAKGTGIGLSIVQRIIYEHGGLIEVDSQPGKGTTFIIKMPIKLG